MAGRRDDDELIRFVESLSPRPRTVRRPTLLQRIRPLVPTRSKPALVALLASVFAMASGLALAATAPARAADATVDCTLVVPADPLSAQGLATPYRLLAPCQEADPGSSAFVQATIVDPATGALSVYNPVVVDDKSTPAAPPVVPKLPAGAVVGIWFGFNGDNLTLGDSGGSLTAGACVNGLSGSIFGQYAYCGAPAFFKAANDAIAAGKLAVPDIGTGKDGRPCPTTRDFGLVDMDQSDNVTATYIFLPDGTTAQNTAANQAALAAKGAKVQVNGSDEGLLDNFVMPALGCTPFTAPDLADNGHPATALALNELQAAAHQAPPVALVPTNDPMTLVGGKASVAKTNLYRAGVNMSPVDTATQTPAAYCRNLLDIGVPHADNDRTLTAAVKTPDPAAATNLFTFLAQRLSSSFDELGCDQLLHATNPVVLTRDKNGVTTAARFNLPSPSPSPSRPAPSSAAPAPSRPAASSAAPAPSRSTAPASPPAPSPTRAQPSPSRSTAPAPAPAVTTAAPTTAAPTTAAPPPPAPAPTTQRPAATQPAPATHTTTTAAAPGSGGGGGDNSGSDNSAGGGNPAAGPAPAGGAPVAVMPVAATPAPTLTLGAMPAKMVHPAGAADSSKGMSPEKIAGTALLSGGGLVVLIVLIRAVVNARRRRYELANGF